VDWVYQWKGGPMNAAGSSTCQCIQPPPARYPTWHIHWNVWSPYVLDQARPIILQECGIIRWDLRWYLSIPQFLSLWEKLPADIAGEWYAEVKLQSNHLPGIGSSTAHCIALSHTSLLENSDLLTVRSWVQGCGTIPNTYYRNSRLFSGLSQETACNPRQFSHVLNIKGHRQYHRYMHEKSNNITEGRIWHRGWREGQLGRFSFGCPKGAPNGRWQIAPIGSLQLNVTHSYQLWLHQNSPPAALWEINSLLWILNQMQHWKAGNKPSKDMYGPLLLFKSHLTVCTADSKQLLARPCSPVTVPCPPAAV